MNKIILTDSRQQSNKKHHKMKNQYFIENGWMVNRVAITTGGDYQLPGENIGVDTKQDILELINDIQVKVWSKAKIKEEISSLGLSDHEDDLMSIICDDDSDRFPEHEITKWCFEHGCEDLTEKVKNMYVKRHGFFHRGLVRSKAYGTKLYILVENNDGVTSIDDLFIWVNPRSKILTLDKTKCIGRWKNGNPRYARKQAYPNAMSGQTLAKACISMEKKYGCTFEFCKPEEAGKRIIDILTRKE